MNLNKICNLTFIIYILTILMSISALSQIVVLYQKNVIWYDCCFAGTIIIHELIYTCDDCNPGASSITTTLLYVWKNLIFLSFFQIYLMRSTSTSVITEGQNDLNFLTFPATSSFEIFLFWSLTLSFWLRWHRNVIVW